MKNKPELIKIVLSGVLMMLIMGTVYSYSVFRDTIESVYHLTTSESGIPYMISLFFYAMFMGVTGYLLKKIRPIRILFIGIILITSGWIMAAYSTSLFVLTIGYGVLIGTGIGMIYGIPLMAITTYAKEKRGLYIGVVLSGFGVSPLITAPLLSKLIERLGIQSTFLIMSLVSLVLLSTVAVFYKSLDKTSTTHKEPFKKTIRKPQFIKLYMVFFISTFIGLSVIGFTSTYAIKTYSFSHSNAALIVSLFAIFNGVGRILYGYLLDKFSIKSVMIVSFASILFASIIALLEMHELLFILAYIIFWLNLGGWLSIAPFSIAHWFDPIDYTRNYGFLFSAYGLSALVGVYVTGVVYDINQSYSLIFLFFSLLSITGILIVFTLKQAKEQ